jgi:uroporphyrinogen-III synthase
MHVLITRPQEDAASIAQILEARGHRALCAPLLTVHFRDGLQLELDAVQAVLATSANGVRALAWRTGRRDLPLFAVGPQTAEAARRAGFCRIECAHGDAAALAEAVPQWATPDAGILIHAAGRGNGRLKTLLEAKGFSVRLEELYEVTAEETLPRAAGEALANHGLDAVLLFSPRSAAVLRDTILKAGLADTCKNLAALCISAAAAQALDPLAFRTTLVAAQPNQDAMLASLDTAG